MPGDIGRRSSKKSGTIGRDIEDTCDGDERPTVDVDDGSDEEEPGDQGAEGEACADVDSSVDLAYTYRALRDDPLYAEKKVDGRLRRMDQWLIENENIWKEVIRSAYDAAAVEVDARIRLAKKNAELRAKIRSLESQTNAPSPSPLA